MKKFTTFFIFLVLLFSVKNSQAEDVYCYDVLDGDTFFAYDRYGFDLKIRLYGIDAPEDNAPFAQEAKAFTHSFVFEKTIDIKIVDIDRHKRNVAVVNINEDETLQEHLIKNGLAYVYSKYCKAINLCNKLYELQSTAKENKIGIWAVENNINSNNK